MNILQSIMIVSLVLGSLTMILSFIKFKKKAKTNYSTRKDFKYYIEYVSSSKLIKALVNKESKSNRETLLKLKTIQSKLTLEKLLVIKVICAIALFSLSLIVKVSFATVAKDQLLNADTIYEQTEYRLEQQVTNTIKNVLGESYIDYIENNNANGLAQEIFRINTDYSLGLDEEDIVLATNIFIDAYAATKITTSQWLLFILIMTLSVPLTDFYVTVKYKMVRSKMVREFEKLELVSISLLSRDDLNILEILKEMEKHSIYLKPYLTKCLRMYNSNPKNALNELIKDVDEPEFKNFIIILASCLDKSKETNQEVLKIQRNLRMMLEETTKSKELRDKELYLTLAQFPLLMLMAFNLIYPAISNMNFDF